LRLHSHGTAWLNLLAQHLLEQVDILHWESHTNKCHKMANQLTRLKIMLL
jgi:hypothetical protein